MTSPLLDLGKGGLFIQTERPMPIGKRLLLEIHVAGEPSAWPALGRVLWVRERGVGSERPPGMGVGFVDVDAAVLAAIDRVLVARGPAEPSTVRSSPPRPVPSREPTVLGVGQPPPVPAPAAPIIVVAPARERTVLGVGLEVVATRPIQVGGEKAWEHVDGPPGVAEAPAGPSEPEPVIAAPAVERSIAIDLISKPPSRVRREDETAREASIGPAGLPKRRGTLWLLLLFLLLAAAAAGGAYRYRDRLRPRLWSVVREVRSAIAPPATGNP